MGYFELLTDARPMGFSSTGFITPKTFMKKFSSIDILTAELFTFVGHFHQKIERIKDLNHYVI